MDRRALFFAGAALVCAVLIPLTESAQRWLPVILSIVYALLSIASWADARTKARAGRSADPLDDRPGSD